MLLGHDTAVTTTDKGYSSAVDPIHSLVRTLDCRLTLLAASLVSPACAVMWCLPWGSAGWSCGVVQSDGLTSLLNVNKYSILQDRKADCLAVNQRCARPV